MNFFDGHCFSLGGSSPESTATVRNIPLYYGIQFNYRGPLRLQIENGTEFLVEGSYAFHTSGAFLNMVRLTELCVIKISSVLRTENQTYIDCG